MVAVLLSDGKAGDNWTTDYCNSMRRIISSTYAWSVSDGSWLFDQWPNHDACLHGASAAEERIGMYTRGIVGGGQERRQHK